MNSSSSVSVRSGCRHSKAGCGIRKRELSQRVLKKYPELVHFDPEDLPAVRRFHRYFEGFCVRCFVIWIFGYLILGVLSTFGNDTLLSVLLSLWGGLVPLVLFMSACAYAYSRELRDIHSALSRQQIFYCSRCRYNCIGIRGNLCPECGAAVPGLVAE